jgi:hypothetical protein
MTRGRIYGARCHSERVEALLKPALLLMGTLQVVRGELVVGLPVCVVASRRLPDGYCKERSTFSPRMILWGDRTALTKIPP